MAKYVLKADLPEVTVSANRLLVDSEILHFMESSYTAEQHRKDGLARLAIAEYLDNLKPQLPTEPGSVILASKIKNWDFSAAVGMYLIRMHGRDWVSLDGLSGEIAPYDIEEWVSVKLSPQIEVTP